MKRTTSTILILIVRTETHDAPSSSSFPAAPASYDTTAESVPPSRPLAKCSCGAERRRAGGSK